MANFTNRLICFALMFGSMMAVASAQQKHSYVADANREYAAIFSHPENPCAAKQTTSSYVDCIGKEVTFTETHLAKFLTAIRGIASQDDGGTATPPRKTRELDLVNQSDSAWQQYRKNMCDLTSAGMAGGSGETSAGLECAYRMDRTYTQQLADAVSLKTLAE
ncbi:MAG TPA: lysozyme inhibitor LprI family protein [Granulicella sp.]|jgi:uncharacterized protein YecT (DUF1311 family)